MCDTAIITADYRERPSGILDLLIQKNVEVTVDSLLTGDYIINGQTMVERKSAEDFVQSIINNRLFEQCSRMRRMAITPVFLLEGDPYSTHHRMNDQAIRGALLSVKVAWKISVILSKNIEESAAILIILSKQAIKRTTFTPYMNGYKPKRIDNQRLRLLQGLPTIGPRLANRLYNHFGNVRSVMNASKEELVKIEGVRKKVAQDIIDFTTN